MSAVNSNRIEKKKLLRAPRARVWRALADAGEFGRWFGMKLDGPFTPGAVRRGAIVPTTVDAQVGAAQKQYEGLPFEITVERVEPERLLSFRWHPHAVERGVDYSGEPTTLVEFRLQPKGAGTLITVTESGFDAIPKHRRAEAYRMNEGGWAEQMSNIQRHVQLATSTA